ncbi:metallophosphoesterase [Profundibacter sp.]
MKLLRRLFPSSPDANTRTFDAPVQPDESFFVIGDLHGCDRLLEQLLDKIDQANKDGQARLVFVGDYVDRGEESAAVLRRLFELQNTSAICLAGNHEDMMLKFIDQPAERGARWIKFGGLQTLASFGVSGVSTGSTGQALEYAREQLVEAMGDNMVEWLRSLPTFWQSGNVAVVHAAADPAVPIGQQQERVLKWGHKDFAQKPRQDGIWTVHGHTIVDSPTIENGRVSVDTGAYATGRLTAASISDQGIDFLQA